MDSKYLTPGVMTELGKHAERVAELPGDFAGIASVLHGLCIHEFLIGMYGVDKVDTSTVQIRRAEELLDRIKGPLDQARDPGDRVATNCRGYTVLAVAMLRAHGVPARARCGFGGYFTPGFWEDHWVVEYYEDGRWKRGDAQIDDVLVPQFKIDFDVTDLPPGKFLTGGEAWQLFRRGDADPNKFGLSNHEAGDWWIAGNLVRDLAALDNVESLPWDCWDPMPKPTDTFDPALFDHLDTTKVPDTVYNAVRDRVEAFT
jgi:hypothetical protein